MRITLDISLYPLDADYKPVIKSFIRQLKTFSDIELVTNQMSTQVRGEFGEVMSAVNQCMETSMIDNEKVVFVTKCLNGDLEISRLPEIG
ncbi:MAG: thiamine-binding protein [Gammaproteobacteria bacterium]|nr:thiamine-binding protein [Gammaproteobacteria bacterium]